jgi:hypothetical protein
MKGGRSWSLIARDRRNPGAPASSHHGMARLAAITAKVITGRTVDRTPLSKTNAR